MIYWSNCYDVAAVDDDEILEKVIMGIKYVDEWFSILQAFLKKYILFPGFHLIELNINLLDLNLGIIIVYSSLKVFLVMSSIYCCIINHPKCSDLKKNLLINFYFVGLLGGFFCLSHLVSLMQLLLASWLGWPWSKVGSPSWCWPWTESWCSLSARYSLHGGWVILQ